MSWDFPSPAERMKDPLRPVKGVEDFAPRPVSRFKLWTPRRRWFSTLADACAAAEDYRQRTGCFVAITEHPARRASWAT